MRLGLVCLSLCSVSVAELQSHSELDPDSDGALTEAELEVWMRLFSFFLSFFLFLFLNVFLFHPHPIFNDLSLSSFWCS